MPSITGYTTAQSDKQYLRVLIYTGSAYPARPASSAVPAGYVRYIGPSAPTDALANDEWINNS